MDLVGRHAGLVDFRADAEAARAGPDPFGHVGRADAADRGDPDVFRQDGLERLQVGDAIGRGGEQLQAAGAGVDGGEGLAGGGEAGERDHADDRGAADDLGIGVGRDHQPAAGRGHGLDVVDREHGAAASEQPAVEVLGQAADADQGLGRVERDLDDAHARRVQGLADGQDLVRLDPTDDGDHPALLQRLVEGHPCTP